MTTDGGSAGTCGDRFRCDEPPTPRKDQPDPAEPGSSTTGQRRRTR